MEKGKTNIGSNDGNSEVLVFKIPENVKKISIVQDEKYKDLEEDELLQFAIEKLPKAYNFEIFKSIIRIRELKDILKRRPRVALQMPDGFMLFCVIISDILETFSDCETVILGDITYGACCIDDLGSKALNCDFIIHYGHSCLIPVTESCVKSMYVFVDIQIDVENLVQTIELNFTNKEQQTLVLLGSIQYNNSVFLTKKRLIEIGYKNLIIPQTKPRSNGEVLGCTSPKISLFLKEQQVKNLPEPIVIFVCDGRFHMESAMIANPEYVFYQYNPFLKILSLEEYDVELMKTIRKNMIKRCRECKTVGIIFGILGRQGNPDVLENIINLLEARKIKFYVIMLSEITEDKLNEYKECESYVQIACPRISIDWGSYFTKAVITPYEAFVCWGKTEWSEIYPMDYYSNEGGEWSNYYNRRKNKSNKEKGGVEANIYIQKN